MEYKQPKIIAAIREKIASGVYVKRLPTALQLAAEFGVNVKTVQKAVRRLIAAGCLSAKPRSGICVADHSANVEPMTIEVIFEGYTALISHPFWGEIWIGLLDKLCLSGFRPELTMLKSDPDSGLLKLETFQCRPAAGRVLLGISERRLFKELKQDGVPFIVAGDPVKDTKVPQVSFDFSSGIFDAVKYLREKGHEKIAFVGLTKSFSDSGVLGKFRAYCDAFQEYSPLDAKLIEDARPLKGRGREAVERLLSRGVPDAIIAAYDTQVPEMFSLLKERKIDIPVIGCDGLQLAGLSPLRPMVAAPLRRCGELAALNLINAIDSHRNVRSERLAAKFTILMDQNNHRL